MHLPAVLRPEKPAPAAETPAAPQRIVRSVAPGGAPELEKELLAIFERTYGAVRRRDILPVVLRSEDKQALIREIGPAEEFVLVDGYNILFAWDELKDIARDNLDAARHLLMNLLCNYQAYRGCAVILVFDAYRVPQGLGAVEKYHNLYIVYTKEAETADQYIERVTYELHGRRHVRVATSDNLEQLIILGHGAVRVSAREFHDEVMAVSREISRILQENNRKNG
jgi:predicted RNA-binding protein with PIN domain